jgi:hypothetical protein
VRLVPLFRPKVEYRSWLLTRSEPSKIDLAYRLFGQKKASHRHYTLNIQKENPTTLSLTGQL